MFCFETDNKKVGDYLNRLIKRKYSSIRRFCREYLLLRDGNDDDEETRKLLNRFSQILKGKKTIQTHDLPYITELLNVSCEEILSAGQNRVPISNHVTNYSVAFSDNEQDWESYLRRKDKLFLNYDEYGKSVLDYAIEFKNYDFLKFLTNKGYIKFKDSSDAGFSYNYGAETTIKRRDVSHTDILAADIQYSDDLRVNMIMLAIENKDYQMLELLHARETPAMHFTVVYNSAPQEQIKYDFSKIVSGIAKAPDDVLEYFAEEYKIREESLNFNAFFVYQHIDAVIESLVKNNDKRALSVIKAVAKHNQNVYEKVSGIRREAVNTIIKQLDCSEKEAESMLFVYSWFHPECNAFRFSCRNARERIVTNIIQVDMNTSDIEIFNAINEMNYYYKMVRMFVDEER